MTRATRMLVGLVATVTVVAATGAAASPARAPSRVDAVEVRRCCFEVLAIVGGGAGGKYDNADPLTAGHDGVHDIAVTWTGVAIMEYVERGRGAAPVLRLPLGPAGFARARIGATLEEYAFFGTSDEYTEGREKRCPHPIENRFVMTGEPGRGSIGGYIPSRSFLLFSRAASGWRLTLDAGAPFSAAGGRCGLGVSHLAAPPWEGAQGPWRFTGLVPPARGAFRRGRAFQAPRFVVRARHTEAQSRPGEEGHAGSAEFHVAILFQYFPRAQLSARLRGLDRSYPLTRTGFREINAPH